MYNCCPFIGCFVCVQEDRIPSQIRSYAITIKLPSHRVNDSEVKINSQILVILEAFSLEAKIEKDESTLKSF